MSATDSTWAVTTRGDGIDALQRVTMAAPTPGPQDIVVREAAVALNYRDLLVINGVASWKPTAARVPISDGVGVVVDAEAGVSRFQVGDRVAGIFLPKWIDGDLTDSASRTPTWRSSTRARRARQLDRRVPAGRPR